MAGNTQKANALSASHRPSDLEGNACKCPRSRQIVPTRPSVKCQRCVVGINLGFGDGRGITHVPLSTSRSGITYRSLLDLFSCWSPLFLITSGSNDLRRSPHLCGLSYRAFLGLGPQPQTGSTSSSRPFHGPLSSATPRHLPAFCRRAKGGCSPCSHGGHTTYRMTMTPVLLDTFADQDRRKMHAGPLITFDPRFPPVHHRTVGVLAGFRTPSGCFGDADRLCCFGVGHVL